MGGTLLMAAFLGCGLLCGERLFQDQGRMTRSWLGLTIGLVMMLWLPSLMAFLMEFTLPAQLAGLGAAGILTLLVWKLAPRRGPRRALGAEGGSEPPLALVLALVVPMTLLMLVLQYTHTLRPVDGALHVGQCTFGDLNLHLGIATGLRDASYPPEYTLLPGTLLGYPFLMDALSASMLLAGSSLTWSFILPGVVFSALVFWGFIMLAWELVADWRAVCVAFLLMFFNGGFGFVYALDQVAADPSRWQEIFQGFYRAPANLVDKNVRWSNVLADMMLPQRTLLAGWTLVIPALYLLVRAVRTQRLSLFVGLGLLAGAMPMVHTHSFLALGLISTGAMVYSLACAQGAERRALIRGFAAYGGLAIALALPQLMIWTFPQTVQGGSLRLCFNWVNSRDGRLIDDYLWFWVKNVGPVYLIMIPAVLNAQKQQRLLAVGALVTYTVAEFVLFQPNEYDNNKLFYLAFLVMLPLAAQYLLTLYDRLKGVRGRALLATVFLAVSLLSGTLSVGRELVSDYELYSESETAAARYLDENAPRHATVLTGGQHNNPVSSLAGKNLVCGTSTFLYFHGVDYSAQEQAVEQMYTLPAESLELFDAYQVDYLYISSYERGDYDIDEAEIARRWPVWFEAGDVVIYAISQRAQEGLG